MSLPSSTDAHSDENVALNDQRTPAALSDPQRKRPLYEEVDSDDGSITGVLAPLPSLEGKHPRQVPSIQACLESVHDAQVARPKFARTPANGKKFRLCTSQLFLTYPQCQLDKEVALAALRVVLPGVLIEDYIIAQENHEVETSDTELLRQGFKETDLPRMHEVGIRCGLHLHIYLKLSKKLDTTNAHYLDIIPPQGGQPYHGNYQGVTNRIAVLRYITKEDKEPLSNIEWESQINSAMEHGRTPKDYTQQNAVALDVERSVLDLVRQGEIPWSSMLRLEQFRASVSQQSALDTPRIEAFTFTIDRPWSKGSTYTQRVRFPIRREEGPSIIWLYGAGKTGKTWCARNQHTDEGELIPYADVNTDKEFSTYRGQQLLVFNEYSGWCETADLIRMTEGEAFKVKFGYPLSIPKDVLLIITSNRTPEECYAKVRSEQQMHWEAFRSRVQVIELRGANPECPVSWPNVTVHALSPPHVMSAVLPVQTYPQPVSVPAEDEPVAEVVQEMARPLPIAVANAEESAEAVPAVFLEVSNPASDLAAAIADAKKARHLAAVDAKLARGGQVRLDAFVKNLKKTS